MKRPLLLLACLLVLTGCDGDDKTDTAPTVTPAPEEQTLPLRVYFLRDGKVQPVRREIRGKAVARGALRELLAGPAARERNTLGLTTAIPPGTKVTELTPDGIATVALSGELGTRARAQLVYTLTQFPTIRRVRFGDGDRVYGRADFEEQTPSVLIELPLAFQRIASPLHVFGTANTFEGTFDYELVDSDGEVVTKDVVTASSGSGTRGTFELTRSFEADGGGDGKLVVFERSAEDGSRVKVIEIPVRF